MEIRQLAFLAAILAVVLYPVATGAQSSTTVLRGPICAVAAGPAVRAGPARRTMAIRLTLGNPTNISYRLLGNFAPADAPSIGNAGGACSHRNNPLRSVNSPVVHACQEDPNGPTRETPEALPSVARNPAFHIPR